MRDGQHGSPVLVEGHFSRENKEKKLMSASDYLCTEGAKTAL